jgi:hypothetical protein
MQSSPHELSILFYSFFLKGRAAHCCDIGAVALVDFQLMGGLSLTIFRRPKAIDMRDKGVHPFF